MQLKKMKPDFSNSLLYLAFGAAMLFLAQIGQNGEPFGLALLFAMMTTGLSPFLSAFLYFFSSFFLNGGTFILLYGAQALLLSMVFFLRQKYNEKEF